MNNRFLLSHSAPLTIALFLACALLIMGLSLDHQSKIELSSFAFAYLIATVVGVMPIIVLFMSRTQQWVRIPILLVASLVLWRICFFPIMVLAGYITTLVESLLASLAIQLTIYPALFLVAALLHTATMVITIAVFHKRSYKQVRAMLCIIGIPLLLLAGIVSFINESDWQVSPYSIEDENALSTQAHAPSANPYPDLLKQDDFNWRQRVLLYTGLITYELIPDNGVWAQRVKGTLEQDLRIGGQFSSRFFTISHLNAYWLANKSGYNK